jgi:hypothetical protein
MKPDNEDSLDIAPQLCAQSLCGPPNRWAVEMGSASYAACSDEVVHMIKGVVQID